MITTGTCTRKSLTGFKPDHPFFIGIDSDGCVMNTMEIKQKRCFHPLIISHWQLEPVADLLRETAEFTNLYSLWRGSNRFITLVLTFDLLARRDGVVSSGIKLPHLETLRKFNQSGLPLDNPGLEKAAIESGDPEMFRVLEWSRAVNKMVASITPELKPFPGAVAGLRAIAGQADTVCVSQTPTEALAREWQSHGLDTLVKMIAGQELGSKSEHIRMAAAGKYDIDRILMIGDAPGDKIAAKANGALFFPVNPSREDISWERFMREGLERFLNGTFRGQYEEELVHEFESLLPGIPPWEQHERQSGKA